jgi:hypothetical protein
VWGAERWTELEERASALALWRLAGEGRVRGGRSGWDRLQVSSLCVFVCYIISLLFNLCYIISLLSVFV